MQKPTPAQSGEGPQIFVCYSHADAADVYREVEHLQALGFRCWYDDAIAPGETWTQELADAIASSGMLVFFVTPRSVASRNCLNEVQYALSRGIKVLALHLEPTDLPGGLELALGTSQAVFRYELTEQAYTEKLARVIERHGREADPSSRLRRPERARPLRGRMAVAAGLLLIVALALAVLTFRDSSWTRPTRAGAPSVAVLPFADRTGRNQDICYGVAEELLNLLARAPDLRVMTSALSFAVGDPRDIASVAATLKSDYIVHGSLLGSDESFRLLARLVDASTGELVWSGEYDGDVANVFMAQQRIASSVAQSLEAAVAFTTQDELAPLEPRAVEHYLAGQELLRNSSSLESAQEAQARFTAALEVQPSFTPALAGLCRARLKEFSRTEDPSAFDRAQSTCLDVLERDDGSIQSRVALAGLYNRSGRYPQAKAVLDEATARSPNFEPIYYQLAQSLEGLGQLDAAERAYQRSIALEPSYWGVYLGYGNFLALHQRYGEALVQYGKITELAPEEFVGYASLGVTQYEMGKFDDAIGNLERSLTITQSSRTYFNLGLAYRSLGNHEAARDALSQAVALNPRNYRALTFLGEAYEATGESAQAQETLTRALEVADELSRINPEDALVLAHTASLLARLGRGSDALDRAQQAVRMAPRDPKVRLTVGLLRAGQGDQEGALADLRAALTSGLSASMFLTEPATAPFRSDPEIERLLAQATR